ncbi:aminopeptidase [Vibrio tubiashii]|nr:aminopeptidase [Vibrio tubiashii]
MVDRQTEFGLLEYQADEGRIIIRAPRFDFDTFPKLAARLVTLLSASVVEKQWDADIHSWLIDFEGCQLFLKSEHYSESVWFEALVIEESREELDFLASLFRKGF